MILNNFDFPSIRFVETYCNEVLLEMKTVSFEKIHLKYIFKVQASMY